MPTNPIGSGTCNLSVNVPKAWRRYLGRLAFRGDMSLGELVRRMIARASHVWTAARDAATAERADLEAVAVIRRAIADGISEADRPAIERAIGLVQLSAATDGNIARAARISLEEVTA